MFTWPIWFVWWLPRRDPKIESTKWLEHFNNSIHFHSYFSIFQNFNNSMHFHSYFSIYQNWMKLNMHISCYHGVICVWNTYNVCKIYYEKWFNPDMPFGLSAAHLHMYVSALKQPMLANFTMLLMPVKAAQKERNFLQKMIFLWKKVCS